MDKHGSSHSNLYLCGQLTCTQRGNWRPCPPGAIQQRVVQTMRTQFSVPIEFAAFSRAAGSLHHISSAKNRYS